MTGFRCFHNVLGPYALDESSPRIGRVKWLNYVHWILIS